MDEKVDQFDSRDTIRDRIKNKKKIKRREEEQRKQLSRNGWQGGPKTETEK